MWVSGSAYAGMVESVVIVPDAMMVSQIPGEINAYFLSAPEVRLMR